MKPDSDVVIVGAGMAGMTAALWARRLGLSVTILESEDQPGGQLPGIQDRLIDFPGFTGSGLELAETVYGQIKQADVRVLLNTRAIKQNSVGSIHTSAGEVSARALVLATGLRRRRIPMADSLPEGIVFYTSQPRQSFRGDKLIILGGGDGAVENAILLAAQWNEITIVHRSASLRARPAMLSQLSHLKNVKVVLAATLESIQLTKSATQRPDEAGDPADGAVRAHIRLGEGQREITANRILVKAGFEASNELLTGFGYSPGSFALVSMDQKLLSKESLDGQTREVQPPLWLAGDICTPQDPSLVVAAGQACLAMRSVERWLRTTQR